LSDLVSSDYIVYVGVW